MSGLRFQEYLRRPEEHIREYLAGRGLTEEAIKAFRIGFAPDSGFVLRDRLRGEFEEDVLRESGVFSWKAEGSRQPSAVRPQQSNRSLDSARDDRAEVGAQNDSASDLKPTTNDQRPTTAAMY
jgi:DNA primase